MSKTNYQKVVEFNKVFGIPVHNEPQKGMFDEDQKLVEYRMSLIREENKELNIDGIAQKNLKEVIDALSDLLYVIYGMGATLGLNLDKGDDIYPVYQNGLNPFSNEELEDGEKTNYQYVVKWNKFHNLTVNDEVQKDVFNTNSDLVKSSAELISSQLERLERAVKNKNMVETRDSLYSMLYFVYSMGASLGVNMDTAMGLVHDSNMSKSCKTEQEAIDTVEDYKKNDERYDSPAYRKSPDGDYYVVYNESTKKILKNMNYKPVNFSEMLD